MIGYARKGDETMQADRNEKPVVKNTRTNPELKKKMKEISDRLMERNHKLYKSLENK